MMTAREQNELIDTISGYCKKLFFTSAIPEMCQNEGTPKQIQIPLRRPEAEIGQREENRIGRLIKRARFPVYKTFDDYDFKRVKLPPALSRQELIEGSFIEKKKTLSCTAPSVQEKHWRSPPA